MKLIIDINEVKYNEIVKHVNAGWSLPYLETIIANGTPLSEEHDQISEEDKEVRLC